MRREFRGSIVALVTPFRDGKVDEARLRELVEFHVRNGTDAIVPCGTTGESPTLSHDEHKRVVEVVIDTARGRIPVIAGTGSNSTAEAIDLTTHAKKAGADGALVVSPYYNKPTQQGLYEHFKAVAEAGDLLILVYNIQSRTAVNVETETLARLARDCPSIVGVKEASGSLEQMTQVIVACGPEFTVLSGDDALTLPLMAVGGRGVISVLANIVPKETAEMTHAALDGDWKRARELHLRLFPLSKALFIETNPIPVKEAMAMMGLIQPELRLPLCRMAESNRERLRKVLAQYHLVKETVPVVSASAPRMAGLHSGSIWTSDDFDEPLPEAFWVGTA
jgi:4-hydroxy-tetrahydrodipicolinate synthase